MNDAQKKLEKAIRKNNKLLNMEVVELDDLSDLDFDFKIKINNLCREFLGCYVEPFHSTDEDKVFFSDFYKVPVLNVNPWIKLIELFKNPNKFKIKYYEFRHYDILESTSKESGLFNHLIEEHNDNVINFEKTGERNFESTAQDFKNKKEQ